MRRRLQNCAGYGCCERSSIRRLKIQTQRIYELEMKKVKKVRTLSFMQGSILIVLKQSILFVLLWLIFRKVLSPGELISMQFISTSIIGPLQDLGSIILSYREAEASMQIFNELTVIQIQSLNYIEPRFCNRIIR